MERLGVRGLGGWRYDWDYVNEIEATNQPRLKPNEEAPLYSSMKVEKGHERHQQGITVKAGQLISVHLYGFVENCIDHPGFPMPVEALRVEMYEEEEGWVQLSPKGTKRRARQSTAKTQPTTSQTPEELRRTFWEKTRSLEIAKNLLILICSISRKENKTAEDVFFDACAQALKQAALTQDQILDFYWILELDSWASFQAEVSGFVGALMETLHQKAETKNAP